MHLFDTWRFHGLRLHDLRHVLRLRILWMAILVVYRGRTWGPVVAHGCWYLSGCYFACGLPVCVVRQIASYTGPVFIF